MNFLDNSSKGYNKMSVGPSPIQSVSPKMSLNKQNHFMNKLEKSEVILDIKNSYASKYEIPIIDKSISDDNLTEKPSG